MCWMQAACHPNTRNSGNAVLVRMIAICREDGKRIHVASENDLRIALEETWKMVWSFNDFTAVAPERDNASPACKTQLGGPSTFRFPGMRI